MTGSIRRPVRISRRLEPHRAASPSATRSPSATQARVVEGSRDRLSLALGSCPERKRLVLALLLFERLSPAEAATALGVTLRHLETTFRETLGGLRQAALGGATFPVARSRPRGLAARVLRRAS